MISMQSRNTPTSTGPMPFRLADGCGIRRRGLIVAISAPSGTGKSTICRALLSRNTTLLLSVSVTTRGPRPGEINGRDYHFISLIKFRELIAKGALLEHAKIFGHYYGTLSQPVADSLRAGRDVLFDINWQGYRQLKNNNAQDIVGIFVFPPSIEELEQRLRGRGQDSHQTITHRLQTVTSEISHWEEYHYVLVNRNIEHSIATIQTILKTESLRTHRQTGWRDFVNSLKRT